MFLPMGLHFLKRSTSSGVFFGSQTQSPQTDQIWQIPDQRFFIYIDMFWPFVYKYTYAGKRRALYGGLPLIRSQVRNNAEHTDF